MKVLAIFLLIGIILCIETPNVMNEHIWSAFEAFVVKYKREYFSENERAMRFEIFKNNYFVIDEHNRKSKDWEMEMNHFGDMTRSEHKELFHNLPREEGDENISNISNISNIRSRKLPKLKEDTRVDWSSECGIVENQGKCGSCYAFSAIQSLQWTAYKSTGTFEYFSPQQIIDCSEDYGNSGCHGGWPQNSMNYTSHKGILSAALYPYTATHSKCNKEGGWKNNGFVENSPPGNDNILAHNLLLRPISVCVDANTWAYYARGNIYIIYIYL